MGAFIDLTGHKYGMLTVIDRAPNIGKRTAWNCQCECGNVKAIQSNNLRSGNSESCGCQTKRGKELIELSRLARLEESKKRAYRKKIWHSCYYGIFWSA